MKNWLLATFLAINSVRHMAEAKYFAKRGNQRLAKFGEELAASEKAAALRLIDRI